MSIFDVELLLAEMGCHIPFFLVLLILGCWTPCYH